MDHPNFILHYFEQKSICLKMVKHSAMHLNVLTVWQTNQAEQTQSARSFSLIWVRNKKTSPNFRMIKVANYELPAHSETTVGFNEMKNKQKMISFM